MREELLFADETSFYRNPCEAKPGETVTFRFRTGRGERAEVYFVTALSKRRMEKKFSDELFDYYETTELLGESPFEYSFEIRGDSSVFLWDKTGLQKESEKEKNPFILYPGFFTPDWAKGAIIYQIYVDRFYKGNPESGVLNREYCYLNHPVEAVEDWHSIPEKFDVHRFYGGDLVGVKKKLDYLQSLGVEVLYLNPVFLSPSNHKYDVQDYNHIDPHLVGFIKDEGEVPEEGDTDNRHATRYLTRIMSKENLGNADSFFAELVEEIHARKMKIILDGVFNHTASFHYWMDREKIYDLNGGEKGAYLAKESPYHDYYLFEKDEWPDNASYKSWCRMETLPKLNYRSQALQNEILAIARKWLSPPYCIDGWRLDVAADIGESESENHAFWQAFRKTVKEANPDAFILAEHYGSPEPWLRGNEWDTVMNYDGFMDPVSYFLTGLEKHSDAYNASLHGNGSQFFHTLKKMSLAFPVGSYYSAMNQLSNHDHSRFLTRTNRRVGRTETSGSEEAKEGLSYATFREGVILQCTLPGAPTVYYGDEAGQIGWTDPDNRRTYPWGRENFSIISFYRAALQIHKNYEALKTGSFLPLQSDYGYISFGRFDEKDSFLILINHSDHDRDVSIPTEPIGVPRNGTMIRLMETTEMGYNVGEKEIKVKEGIFKTRVIAWSAAIYMKKGERK